MGRACSSLVGDFEALSDHAFGDLDAEFAARARALRGGFVVAGERFGAGIPWDTAALVLVKLGVRAVMARSVAPDFGRCWRRPACFRSSWSSGDEGRGVNPGDELEMPGVPEAFVSGSPDRGPKSHQGSQYTLRHALAAHEVERLRHGGLLAEIVGSARSSAGAMA